jgi:hypothetical protein
MACSARTAGKPNPAALVGVLALQGDFEAHAKILDRLGARQNGLLEWSAR